MSVNYYRTGYQNVQQNNRQQHFPSYLHKLIVPQPGERSAYQYEEEDEKGCFEKEPEGRREEGRAEPAAEKQCGYQCRYQCYPKVFTNEEHTEFHPEYSE